MYKKHLKQVKCRSGLTGYQCRLQENYHSYEQFKAYAEVFALHTRLGYNTIAGAWRANPMIQGSVNPSDFRKVKVK